MPCRPSDRRKPEWRCGHHSEGCLTLSARSRSSSNPISHISTTPSRPRSSCFPVCRWLEESSVLHNSHRHPNRLDRVGRRESSIQATLLSPDPARQTSSRGPGGEASFPSVLRLKVRTSRLRWRREPARRTSTCAPCFELHKHYGFTKFVIAVPSVADQGGSAGEHRSDAGTTFHSLYSAPFDAQVYDSKNLGRVRQFAISNTMQILILNIDAFRKDVTADGEEGSRNAQCDQPS